MRVKNFTLAQTVLAYADTEETEEREREEWTHLEGMNEWRRWFCLADYNQQRFCLSLRHCASKLVLIGLCRTIFGLSILTQGRSSLPPIQKKNSMLHFPDWRISKAIFSLFEFYNLKVKNNFQNVQSKRHLFSI